MNRQVFQRRHLEKKALEFQNLPNLFILGAAKAGTTTLYDILKQNPKVYFSYVKEPMFFSCDEYYQRGIIWYAQNFFPKAGAYPIRGEASPHYLYWAEKVAPRIKELYDKQDVKFIITLRDPVQRAYSWYWNMLRENKEELLFTDALKMEAKRFANEWDHLSTSGSMVYGYFRGGCYATQVEEYLRYFSREQFFFLLQEDLSDFKGGPFLALLQFLGLDTQFEFSRNISNQASMPRSRALHNWLHGPSLMKDIFKKLIPLRWRYHFKISLAEANLQNFSYPKIDDLLAAKLRKRYRGEIERLEHLIQRDLSHWKVGV